MRKILPDRVPQRIVERRPPQMAEQLVEVPTEPVYVLKVIASKVFSRRELLGLLPGASGSGILEEVVDNPVPQGRGGGGARGGLRGSRARQSSTAAEVEQIVDVPARRGLPDFLPGQSATASSSSRLRDDADEGFQGFFFALFPVGESAKLCPHSGSELLPESSPSTRRACVDADGIPMVDDEDGNTRWESCSGGSHRTV